VLLKLLDEDLKHIFHRGVPIHRDFDPVTRRIQIIKKELASRVTRAFPVVVGVSSSRGWCARSRPHFSARERSRLRGNRRAKTFAHVRLARHRALLSCARAAARRLFSSRTLFSLATASLFFLHFSRRGDDGSPSIVAVASTVHVGDETRALDELHAFLKYHSGIHVGRFYLFVEGDDDRRRGDARARAVARRFNAVVVSKDDVDKRRRSLSSKAFLRPYLENATACEGGASALFVRQTVHLEMAIELARRERDVAWLVHIDVDEALYPADSASMDIRQVLGAVPRRFDRVVFPNHEAVPEGEAENQPTTLFRKNHRTVDAATYARYASLARGSKPNYFAAYSNGKSAARIDASSTSDLRAHGAHRFMSSSGRETTAAETVVLHFPFGDASRARRRATRCACADVDLCSMLPFDRLLAREARERPESFDAFFDAAVVERDATRKSILLKAGVYTRIHAVALTLRL
jgi:hypothetical protein